MISKRGWFAPHVSVAAYVCAGSFLFAAQTPVGSGLSATSPPQAAAPSTRGQAPVPATSPLSRQQAQAESGLETPWDVRKILADLLNENEQLQPLLAALNPQQWYDKKGAPSTYIIQWQAAHGQLNDVKYATMQLQGKTESLSLAIDLYFRLEALETTTRSLSEGAQRYADRATADKLTALIARNFNSRERLRDYLRDLTTSTEQNFKIADEEAQSCRAQMSKLPASRRSRK